MRRPNRGCRHATVRTVKVFISWSGEAERRVAEALRSAITTVCAGRAQPFVSSQDIPKGERGVPFIDAQLASNDYGIVVLSAANHTKPWINYEGGAMASTLDNPVATVLLDLSLADFDGPLRPRQATKFTDRQDMRDLFIQIAAAADPGMPVSATEILFDSAWPTLQASWTPDSNAPHQPLRTSADMLAEVVDRVRNIEALQRRSSSSSARAREANRRSHFGFAGEAVLPDRIAFGISNTIDEITAAKVRLVSVGTAESGSIRVRLAGTADDQATYGPILQHRLRRLHPEALWHFSWELLLPEVDDLVEPADTDVPAEGQDEPELG
ncbi:TIR domain-containing protein [Curtobacterium sp. 9128]|nr:TIR domain-containing protein [Curtobacterium sp. 9128]